MNDVKPGEPLPRHLGNMDANLRFLGATGLVNAGCRVLEIGSGTGAMLHALRERGCDVQGVELRQAFIDQAHAWYGDLPITRVSDLTLPSADQAFDVVLSFDVFEHIADSDGHLREVRRVLRPGGSYLLQTPNKWTNVVFETIRWKSLTAWREEHCALHSLSELDTRLRQHGFTTVRAYDVPVVNDFFRAKVRRYAGLPGALALALVNPDRFPLKFRTNLYVQATLPGATR